MKFLFALILLIHGLIHSMGFAKAFGYGNITQLTKEISKPSGLLWLMVVFLFIITAILFLLGINWWPLIGMIAVVISQFLIVCAWKDAKSGTIANVIILVVAVINWSDYRFQKMVSAESNGLLTTVNKADKTMVSEDMITHLPPAVQKWMTHSGIIGKEKTYFVRLKQKGELRSKPGAGWLPFHATQYFTPQSPAFVWNTRVKMMPLIYMNGRDKLVNGEGEMQIKVLSVLNIVNEKPGTKINKSAMLRYLAETCWFPSAALSKYIKWSPVDSNSATATISYHDVTVSGIFQFNEAGDMMSFTADRYYGSGDKARLEKWLVEPIAYKEFDGVRIPSKCKVSWLLKEGDFNWLNLEITGIEYNVPELY